MAMMMTMVKYHLLIMDPTIAMMMMMMMMTMVMLTMTKMAMLTMTKMAMMMKIVKVKPPQVERLAAV